MNNYFKKVLCIMVRCVGQALCYIEANKGVSTYPVLFSGGEKALYRLHAHAPKSKDLFGLKYTFSILPLHMTVTSFELKKGSIGL